MIYLRLDEFQCLRPAVVTVDTFRRNQLPQRLLFRAQQPRLPLGGPGAEKIENSMDTPVRQAAFTNPLLQVGGRHLRNLHAVILNISLSHAISWLIMGPQARSSLLCRIWAVAPSG